MRVLLFYFLCLLDFLALLTPSIFESVGNGLTSRESRNYDEAYGHLLTGENTTDFKSSKHYPAKPLVARARYRNFEDCRIIGVCAIGTLREGTDAQSIYDDIGSLQWYGTWGWQLANPMFPQIEGMNAVFADTRWNPNNFVCIEWHYNQYWIGDEGHLARYKAWFNMVDGVIIVGLIQSPINPIIPDWVPEADRPQQPPLTKLSDWLFVIWKDQCHNNIRCIRRLAWIIHEGIINESTRDVAKQVGGWPLNWQPHWPRWQGIQNSYDADTSPAKIKFDALVGCPNGWGIVYMLSQHRAAFGRKMIDEVRVFACDDRDILCMAWHIRQPPPNW